MREDKASGWTLNDWAAKITIGTMLALQVAVLALLSWL